MGRAGLGSCLSLMLLLCASVAHAETRRFDFQLFLPPPSPGSTFLIDRPAVPRHLSFVLGLGTSFALAPFERTSDELDRESVVQWLFQTELLASIGLFEAMELGVAVPLSLASVARDAVTDEALRYESAASLGDVRLYLKVPILRGDFALSGRAVVTLPTGDDTAFLGPGYWTVYPNLVASYGLGALTLGGELGYRMRKRAALAGFEQDDEIQAIVGGAYALSPSFSVIADAQLRVGAVGRTLRLNEVPFDYNGGVRVAFAEGMTVDVGIGRGTGPGYGTPAFRAFAVARYASENEPCAEGPEDYDGYLDGDFCADLDNDADRVLDANDECPNDPEDADGFVDDDGCPDADNDADGVLDGDDLCPVDSEDRDGFEDQNGCPELDNDADGIEDGVDECPMEPEDADEFQDDDGCPEPGPDTPVVTLTDTRVLISERVYFDFDADTIRSVSMPLLDQVAAVLRDLPAGRRVRVEGYTDGAGNQTYNLDLSFRRARSVVEYLVGRGIPRNRLEYVGYGPRNPIAPNDTPEGQALNRRVDFVVVSDGSAPAEEPRPRRGRRAAPPATP